MNAKNRIKNGTSLLEENPKEGDLSVWHIPQVPMHPFRVSVSSPEEGKRLIKILSFYDLFQYENNIKPDYSNANGLDMFEEGEWLTWYDEDGCDIDELEFDQNGILKPED
jgi:hypothetical protein